MIDDKIKQWVDDYLNQGYSIVQIKQNLINFGYTKEEIEILIKDKKEVQKNIESALSNPNHFDQLKEKLPKYYVLIPTAIIIIALISASAFFVFGNKSEDSSECFPIFISLEKVCKTNEKIILNIKNEGISFSEFNYYINNKLANKEVFIFDPEKTTQFSIKTSLFETEEARNKFSKINSVTFTPISNSMVCKSKSVTSSKLNDC